MNKPINLPDPCKLNKQEILDLLLNEEYGYLPSAPYSVTAALENCDERFCAGKADLKTLRLCCKADWGEFSFQLRYVCPNDRTKKIPAFIHINFSDLIPDKYQPTEEIIDEGVATLTFCYKDVSSDDGDFTNGLAGVVYPNGVKKDNQCGKIGLWAWAARAVMDYAQTLPELDSSKICVIGHSRLGKTALLAGALDERFFCAVSNNSGCSGAALSREKNGESIRDILNRFPFWFCKNYEKYADNESALPFDQHFLVAANIPHRVYISSAQADAWACPENEYLAAIAASEYYQKHTGSGFIHPDRMPEAGECFHDGKIGYHIRAGGHYLGREDWKYIIKYIKAHGE